MNALWRPMVFNKAHLGTSTTRNLLRKIPVDEKTKNLTGVDLMVLGVKCLIGIQVAITLADFIPYAVKPPFRDGYRQRRPAMSGYFDTLLNIESPTSNVLNDQEVLEKAQKARQQK